MAFLDRFNDDDDDHGGDGEKYMRNARLSFSSGEPLDVTCRASMNSLHRKATSIILINGVIMMMMTVMMMMMMSRDNCG